MNRDRIRLHRDRIRLHRGRILLHRGRICCKYDIYAVYAAFAAYGWDPRAEAPGSGGGKMSHPGPYYPPIKQLASRLEDIIHQTVDL